MTRVRFLPERNARELYEIVIVERSVASLLIGHDIIPEICMSVLDAPRTRTKDEDADCLIHSREDNFAP